MNISARTRLVLLLLGSALCPWIANAAPVMWIHDSQANLAKVDVANGNVSMIGNMGVVMTDIAFDPSGNLYGVSFTDLYRIDRGTAAATKIGSLGVSSMNALVFGSDGTLYAAAASTRNLYTVSPSTGAATSLGSTGFSSGGDLAFFGGDLYLADSSSRLVRMDIDTPADSALIGPFGFSSVFGLATGNDGVLYGVGGTEIFKVNAATGAGTLVSDYSGQGLGQAYGQSFVTEAGAPQEPPAGVPLPSTLALLIAASAFGARAMTRYR